MDLTTASNLVQALAVTLGLAFAAWQIHDYRASRRRDAMLHLLQSFQSPTFARALRLIVNLPDDADAETIRQLVGPVGEDEIYHMTGTWESIGALVFERELTIEIVANSFSGPILLCWSKLKNYIAAERTRLRRDTWSEWFEWLKNQIEAREAKTSRLPAHIAHRAHRDRHDFEKQMRRR